MTAMYTAVVSATGGRNRKVTSNNGVLSLEIRSPKADVSLEQAKELVAKADQVCPYSNSTRGNIEVTFEVSNK